MNKKYLPSALILYLNYFIHGVGCSILGQAVIKDALARLHGALKQWQSQQSLLHLGLGRLIALPFARSALRQTWPPHFHSNRKCFLCNLPDRSCTCI